VGHVMVLEYCGWVRGTANEGTGRGSGLDMSTAGTGDLIFCFAKRWARVVPGDIVSSWCGLQGS